jgi:hypothetical protein
MVRPVGLLVGLSFLVTSTSVLALPTRTAYCSCTCETEGGAVAVAVSPGGNVSAAACQALSGAKCTTEKLGNGKLRCGGDIIVQFPDRPASIIIRPGPIEE